MNHSSNSLATAYLHAVNAHDPAAFLGLFSKDAHVDDAGREFRGLEAIKAWSDSDIFAAEVTLAPTDQRDANDETVVTTIVDGNFDRTGLPDPVVIEHSLRVAEGKIARLSCRLASSR
jgi:hypothetical protein